MDPQVMLGKRKLEDPTDPRVFKKRKIDRLLPTTLQSSKSLETFHSKKKTTKKRRRKINLLACECCRQLHKKCDGNAPHPCSRCIKKKKKCIYKQRKRRGPKSKKRTTSTPVKAPVSMPNQLISDNSQQPQLHLNHQNHATHLHTHLQQLHQSELQAPQTQTLSETIPLEVWPPEYVELPPARPLSASTLQVSQNLPTTGTKASLQTFPFFPGHVLFLQHPPPPPPPNQEMQQESVASSHPNQVQVLAEPWVGGWENF